MLKAESFAASLNRCTWTYVQAHLEGDDNAGLDAPLLSQHSKKTLQEEEEPRSVISLVLPCIAGAAVHATEAACFFPAVSAVALCCYSMVEPSIFSAGESAALLARESYAAISRL